jgi:hypothetical protein
MKLFLNIAIFILAALLIAGCDSKQYQIVTGPDGVIYRLDKKAGTLSVIEKDKIMPPSAESKAPEKKEDYSPALDKPVRWKESRYPGKDLKAKFEMVWREDKLCYRFSVYPYKSLEKVFAKKRQDYIYSLMKPGFTVELTDKNGFLVKEIKVNLWAMTKVDSDGSILSPMVDVKPAADTGEGPKELVLNSQIDCTRQSYESIDGYRIKWGIESEMIEDDGGAYMKSPPIKSGR